MAVRSRRCCSSWVRSAHGIASRRSAGIGSPLSTEKPKVPSSSRFSARSTASSSARSCSARASSTSPSSITSPSSSRSVAVSSSSRSLVRRRSRSASEVSIRLRSRCRSSRAWSSSIGGSLLVICSSPVSALGRSAGTVGESVSVLLRPSLRGLHLAFEVGRLPLALRQPGPLLPKRLCGPLHPGAQLLLSRCGIGKLPLQALELPAGLGQVSPLRRPGGPPRRGAGWSTERRGRSLALNTALEDAFAKLRVTGRGSQRLAGQLHGTRAGGMTGLACGAFGQMDDGADRVALSRGGGAPLSGSLVLTLERAGLGLFELAAGVGEAPSVAPARRAPPD